MKVYLDDNDYYNAALTYARDVESFYTDGEDTDGSYENVELNKNDVPIIQRTFDNFGVIYHRYSNCCGHCVFRYDIVQVQFSRRRQYIRLAG